MQLKKGMALILLVMRQIDILPNLFGRLSSVRLCVKLKVKVSLYTPWRYLEGAEVQLHSLFDLGSRRWQRMMYEEARKLL